jgi:hypothetical protein
LENEEGLWQKIVRKKYLSEEAVGSVIHKLDDSPIWSDLLKIKHIYVKGRTMLVKNGRNTSFWLDTWIYDKPLCLLFPVLFELCQSKNISVHQFLSCQGQISFRRWLTPLLFQQWLGIVDFAYQYNFKNTSDIPLWKWIRVNSSLQNLYMNS